VSRRARRTAGAVVIAAALAGAGCGGDDGTALTETQRTASPALTEAPPPTAPTPTPRTVTEELGTATPEIQTSPTVPERSGGAVAPEEQEGGAGAQEAPQTPVALSVGGTDVRPREARADPFVAIALTVRSSDGVKHSVRIATVPGQLAVPPSGTATRRIAGLQRGTYAVLVDGRTTSAVLRVQDAG